MFSNKLAFGALALACVAAAGGGAYLAVRQTTPPPVAVADGTATPMAATAPAPDQPTNRIRLPWLPFSAFPCRYSGSA